MEGWGAHTLTIAGQLRDLLGDSRSAYMTGGGLGRSGMSETDMDQLGRHTFNVKVFRKKSFSLQFEENETNCRA